MGTVTRCWLRQIVSVRAREHIKESIQKIKETGLKTYFYDRSAYRLSEQAVPSCFVRLDEVFDSHFTTYEDAAAHRCVAMAESLCARMADVEMYAFLMEDARRRHSVDAKGDDKTSILTRSFLVGYLGAGRSLLDVAASALAALYGLPLPVSEATFGNGDFWHQLVSNAPNVHRRYHALRLFVTEFWRWSNETAHRIPPLGAAQHHFGRYAPREQRLQVLDETVAIAEMGAISHTVRWVDPLRLHDRWKPQFLMLCEKVCVDLEKAVA
jgi:hypothetical protein